MLRRPPAPSTVTVMRAPIAARFVLTPASLRATQSWPWPGFSKSRSACASPGVAQQRADFERRLADATAREKKQAQKAVEEATKKAEADHRHRELQLQKQLNDAKRQAADLKRRLEQAPQPIQGEVAQLSLGDMLKRQFPTDAIAQVRKGVRGGDVVQKVYSPSGEHRVPPAHRGDRRVIPDHAG